MPVWGSQHGDLRPDALEPNDAVHPIAFDRRLALQLESELNEERHRVREVVDACSFMQSRSADLSTTLAHSRMLGAPRSEPFVNLTRPSKLGAIMIFRSYEPALEYTPTQAKRLVVAPTVRSMFGCVSGSAIGPPHQLESQSPCPLPAFVAAAAALTSASVNQ